MGTFPEMRNFSLFFLRPWSHRPNQTPFVDISDYNSVKSGGPTSISHHNPQQFHGWCDLGIKLNMYLAIGSSRSLIHAMNDSSARHRSVSSGEVLGHIQLSSFLVFPSPTGYMCTSLVFPVRIWGILSKFFYNDLELEHVISQIQPLHL